MRNFSYFNGNFLPGVFPGPQVFVFVAFAADIPQARKGPDSFNNSPSITQTNCKVQSSTFGYVASLYDAGIELQSIQVIGSDAMRYDAMRHVLQFIIQATRRDAIQCDSMQGVAYNIVNQPMKYHVTNVKKLRRGDRKVTFQKN